MLLKNDAGKVIGAQCHDVVSGEDVDVYAKVQVEWHWGNSLEEFKVVQLGWGPASNCLNASAPHKTLNLN